jgi:YegS/Rv2252/BmrU family lipid kinase
MSAGHSHLLLVNPSAGRGRTRKILPDVERALRQRGIDYELVLTRSLEHARSEARGAAGRHEVVAVMSGDGLLGQIGGELANTGAVMGIIPGGRGNDFARVLGIPSEPDAAADVLAAGNERSIDVGEVNGSRFLCIASCGFDSDANRIANEAHLIKGDAVYLYAALRALAAWRPARFTLRLDGEVHEFTGYSVAVANSRAYGGGMFVAPDAELDDGRFDVVWTSQVGKLHFLANLPKVFKGSHVQNPEVTVIRASEVEIEADRPFAVYADGDPVVELPVKLRLLPRALRVIAPAPSR